MTKIDISTISTEKSLTNDGKYDTKTLRQFKPTKANCAVFIRLLERAGTDMCGKGGKHKGIGKRNKMGVKYVENPPGSRFAYDVVDDPTTEDDRREFRKARICHGWVPSNPTEEEKSLIYRVEKRKAVV